MELLLILIVLLFVSYYFTYVSNTLMSMPFFAPVLKIKNTIIFGTLGLIYSFDMDPLPISNIFLGMIAGSFIDYLLLQNRD